MDGTEWNGTERNEMDSITVHAKRICLKAVSEKSILCIDTGSQKFADILIGNPLIFIMYVLSFGSYIGR